ncbi:EF-hand calcium-binding domain-containing protein 13, partial [Sigmodon hispidus]
MHNAALSKACAIFGKVRQGKIYVNDLPMVFHNLKISMSDSEMRQVLKTVDIDEFQDVLKTFSKMKSGRVAIDEVPAFLANMDISVSSETLKDVLHHSYVDSNHTVDIGDIIFTLDELQQQYEDVSILTSVTCHSVAIMEETTSSKRLSSIPEHLQHKKKGSSVSRMPEPLTSKKLSVPPLQHHSKSMGKHDEPESKPPKTSLPTKKSSSLVDSDGVGSQGPHPKVQDSKSKPSILKSTISPEKVPDKSDTSDISKLEMSAINALETLETHSSNRIPEKNEILHLDFYRQETVHDAINKLQRDYMYPEELQSALPTVGITLSDKEFQKIVPEMTKNESGMVNLNDFIMAVSKKHNFPEYDALNDAIEAINKIQDKKVDYKDLDTCLQNFGVYLPKPELKKIKEMTEVDETKQVNFKEFVDNVLSNTEGFSENLLLPDAIDTLHSLSKDQMDVSHLWDTISSSNSHLKKDEFLDAVKLATVDGDKVQLEEFSKAVKDMRDTSRLK